MTGSTKLLRRRVLVREYEYEEFLISSVPRLYDSADFEPVTMTDLKHLNLIDRIKNPVKEEWKRPKETPQSFIWDHQTRSYRDDYFKFNIDVDDHGYIWLQYRKNTPRSRLGWATMTKEY